MQFMRNAIMNVVYKKISNRFALYPSPNGAHSTEHTQYRLKIMLLGSRRLSDEFQLLYSIYVCFTIAKLGMRYALCSPTKIGRALSFSLSIKYIYNFD